MTGADREILDDLIRTRTQTLSLLGIVPDELLVCQAEGETRPLAWVFEHIGVGANWWMDHVMRDGVGWTPECGGLSSGELHDVLTRSQDRVFEFFNREDGCALSSRYDYPLPQGGTRSLTGRWCVLYLIQHEVHHRGKIVLALRQWGINNLPAMPYGEWWQQVASGGSK